MNQTTLQSKNNESQQTLYMALELSLGKWKIAFGNGINKRIITIEGGDINRLLEEVEKAKKKFGMPDDVQIISCYEAGRDGFWLHRLLTDIGIQNIVVDSASIEVNRRARHAKTDNIDAIKLLEMLVRYQNGETKVWSVLYIPTASEEDDRRLHRELERLKKERVAHLNRIRSLLILQGAREEPSSNLEGYLNSIKLLDGSPFPESLKQEILRECERLRIVENQIRSLEKEQRERLKVADTENLKKVILLATLCGIGNASAWVFVMEFLGWRKFNNRKEVASAAGLAPTPYNSGGSQREQGISKSGNNRIRSMIVEIAWFWLRYQPNSKLTIWFNERFAKGGTRMRRIGIVALARRLLIDLWRYLENGVLPEGAKIKSA